MENEKHCFAKYMRSFFKSIAFAFQKHRFCGLKAMLLSSKSIAFEYDLQTFDIQ